VRFLRSSEGNPTCAPVTLTVDRHSLGDQKRIAERARYETSGDAMYAQLVVRIRRRALRVFISADHAADLGFRFHVDVAGYKLSDLSQTQVVEEEVRRRAMLGEPSLAVSKTTSRELNPRRHASSSASATRMLRGGLVGRSVSCGVSNRGD